jgi:hypothetical protein
VSTAARRRTRAPDVDAFHLDRADAMVNECLRRTKAGQNRPRIVKTGSGGAC